MRPGTRHPLYRTVRVGLVLLSLVSLGFGARHFARTVEEIRHAGRLALPDDDAAFRKTLVGAFVVAAESLGFDDAIREALADQDYERAGALYRVAETVNMSVSPEVTAAYAEAMSGGAVFRRNSWDLARGSVTGYADGAFGLVGAIGTDLLVPLYGDVRDAGIQLWRYMRGEEVDEIILGLASIGLALPIAQAATDPLKAALRLRRASPKLAGQMRVLDTAALRSAGNDVAGILASGGRRATVAALRTAETADDLTVFRRVARALGAEADSYITVLGRRTGMMYRTWGLSLPLVAKLLALGSLLSIAGALLTAALSHSAALKLGKMVGLRWLARWLAVN